MNHFTVVSLHTVILLWSQKAKKANEGRIKAKKCQLAQGAIFQQNASNILCIRMEAKLNGHYIMTVCSMTTILEN